MIEDRTGNDYNLLSSPSLPSAPLSTPLQVAMRFLDDPRLNPLEREDREMVAGLVAVLALLIVGYILWLGWQNRPLTEIDSFSSPAALARHLGESVREFPAIQIDINRADWAELALLPGVGEVLARRIVRLRNTEGPFESIDRLDDVRGIGPKLMLGIRPLVCDPAEQSDERNSS